MCFSARVDECGAVAVRKRLRRGEVLEFFGRLAPCVVGIEACGSAHYWAREIAALGHWVKLMPPAYVKPHLKRGKNDAAEAICEAVMRPTMAFVPVKAHNSSRVTWPTKCVNCWFGGAHRRLTPCAAIWRRWGSLRRKHAA